MQVRRGQLHFGNVDDLLQRAHVAQRELQAVEGQQLGRRSACRFPQPHLRGRHGARNFHHSGRCLLESDLHVGVEQRALQAKRQAGRQVRLQIAQVGLEVEVTQFDSCVGLARVGKRCGFGGGVKAAAVQLEGQARRGLDLALGRQVA